jgi:hypothetical protein
MLSQGIFTKICDLYFTESVGVVFPASSVAGGVKTGACSPAASKISLVLLVLGVVKLVDNANAIIRATNTQVVFSKKSPVFFTPNILLAPEPPNWLVKPPPLEFCAKTTTTNKKAQKRMNPIISVYMIIASILQFEPQSKLFFVEISKSTSSALLWPSHFCPDWPKF